MVPGREIRDKPGQLRGGRQRNNVPDHEARLVSGGRVRPLGAASARAGDGRRAVPIGRDTVRHGFPDIQGFRQHVRSGLGALQERLRVPHGIRQSGPSGTVRVAEHRRKPARAGEGDVDAQRDRRRQDPPDQVRVLRRAGRVHVLVHGTVRRVFQLHNRAGVVLLGFPDAAIRRGRHEPQGVHRAPVHVRRQPRVHARPLRTVVRASGVRFGLAGMLDELVHVQNEPGRLLRDRVVGHAVRSGFPPEEPVENGHGVDHIRVQRHPVLLDGAAVPVHHGGSAVQLPFDGDGAVAVGHQLRSGLARRSSDARAVDSCLHRVAARAHHVRVLPDPDIRVAVRADHRPLRAARQPRLHNRRADIDVHVRHGRLPVAGRRAGEEPARPAGRGGRAGPGIRGRDRRLAARVPVFGRRGAAQEPAVRRDAHAAHVPRVGRLGASQRLGLPDRQLGQAQSSLRRQFSAGDGPRRSHGLRRGTSVRHATRRPAGLLLQLDSS